VELPAIQKSISAVAAYRIEHLLQILWKVLPDEPRMTRFVASQLAGSHSYSIQAARNDFGYPPICSMDDGLQRLRASLLAGSDAAK